MIGIKQKVKNTIRKIVNISKEKEMIAIPKLIDGMHLLKGKTALVTGGSSGIGFAIAEAFLSQECKVIIAGTQEEKLKRCVDMLSRGGKDVRYLVLNVLDVRDIPKKIRHAASLFHENKIDILVNSAGVAGKLNFLDVTEEEYDNIMDINMKGTFFVSKSVGELMIEKKVKGHILNVSSASALRPAWAPYQISKWGVRGFTLGLADTLLPYGIVVNAIAPGPTATPMLGKYVGDSIQALSNPSGRYIMPEEIAQLAVFMVSDFGNMIVGDTFYMTGGGGTITLHH